MWAYLTYAAYTAYVLLKITRSADKATWFKTIIKKKIYKTACEHILKVGIRMNFLSFVSKWKQNKTFANHR